MSTCPINAATLGRWICLLLGALALCFANGVTAHIAAAWIAPLLLLRFVMASRPGVGYGLVVLAVTIASYVTLRGVIPVPRAEFLTTCAISGVLGALPYLGHRMLAPRLGAIIGSLVFPSASVALLYVLSVSGSPFGTWGVDGYVQADFSALTQFASVTGIWGVTFLVFWFASAMHALIPPRLPGSGPAVAAFATGFVAVIGFGMIRIATAPVPSADIDVAALTTPEGLPDKFFEGCASRADRTCREAGARKRWNAFFAHASAAAQQGARLLVWPEAAAQYDAALEQEFIERARDFVRKHHVYLVAGAASVPADPDVSMDNKALVFTPSGELAFEYHKAIPVPGEPIEAGDGVIRTLDTPFGRIGVIICFDADFPMYVLQAKRRAVDVLAIPANDWQAITPLHGQMTRFRAIENGFSVVRATSNGLSLVADSTGTVLKEVDSFKSPGGSAIVQLPVRSRTTLYSMAGDVFAMACVLLTVSLTLVVLMNRLLGSRSRSTTST